MKFDKIEGLIKKVKQSEAIDTEKWGTFQLCKLFPNIFHGARLVKADRVSGDIPLVTAGKFNNGISEYVTPPKNNEVYENCITIDMFGNCFWHDYKFICDDNVYPIPNMNNRYIALFLCSVIHNQLAFDFKKQFRYKQIPDVYIKLPVKEDNPDEPNWNYMETFMKNIETEMKSKLQIS